MKFPISRPLAALISAITIGALVLGTGLGYFLFARNSAPEKFSTLITHADIPYRAMETYQQSLLTTLPIDSGPVVNSTCPALSPTWVQDENQKAGLPNMQMADWKKLDLSAATGSALWLNQSSVSCGDTVDIHAALYQSYPDQQTPGPRTFAAWRIGYYGGAGAREIWRSNPIDLQSRKATTSSQATRFTEALWPVNTKFTIGNDWTPGFYLIVSLSPFGKIENAAPLVVRSPVGTSKLVMMHSFLTWNAYNSFGGRSTYNGPGENATADLAQRSRIGSFDRPIVGSGAFSIQRDAIPFVQFTEEHGLNIDQISDLNLDQNPSLALHYNGVILGGHAEYFTHRMFQTMIALRNSGTNLAFLGANTAYWQIRMEPSKFGPNRHMVIYRLATQDPQTNIDQVTIEFADNRINTPPNLFTGESTVGVHVFGTLKSVTIPQWLTLPSDSSISQISSDTEGEAVQNNVASPPNIHILFAGTLSLRRPLSRGARALNPVVETSWFTTPSGSAIFDAGMTTWTCNLMESCIDSEYSPSSQSIVQSTTLQILTLWQQSHIGVTLK